MKKLFTLMLAVIMAVGCCLGLVACGPQGPSYNEVTFPKVESTTFTQFDELEINDDFKIGLICLHGETSTYDKNFIDAFKAACATFGLTRNQMVIVTDIPEGAECKTKALELADAGCDAIFANSFGHDPYMKEAAAERTNVQFFHATGVSAHVDTVLPNYHNAFASIYEGRYLAGVAAGLKIKEMAENNELEAENFDAQGNVKIGYVGAFTYAEVVSGLTSFYLGVKSQYANVVMDVQFTGSWYDEAGEREAANTLLDRGVALLSQHADSWGAPNACENAGVPNVSYNGSTINACPDTFLISSKIDWTYYFKWIIAQVGSDTEVAEIPTDFAGGLGDSCMVAMSNINGDVMAEGTLAVLEDVRTKLMNGTIKVFDCSTFTVGGESLTSYLADLDGDYVGDTNVIKTEGGITYFAESAAEFRSAPYFDIKIDGINFLNTKF
ncbi:MAG: BMP family ABC transporter substrate-binding protein [Clostridia bacterium]|nr:BMP family ABC transporter substrate-binding protein [Clostridia bacterium]